jgi:hypothetical protein
MGHTASKNSKINKDHNKQKMFRIGISVGRNDLNVEGHLGAVKPFRSSKTIKNYKPIENASTNDEHCIQNDSIQNVEE